MSATNAFDVAPMWKSVASIAFVAGETLFGALSATERDAEASRAYRIDKAGMGEVVGGR